MKKVTLAVVLALTLVLSTIGFASAITNGQPDGDNHPYVGLAVFDVLDENGDQKDPAEFDTAGLPTTLPNGSVLPGGITTTTWYTDDDVPYFVTAYDYPFYSDQHSLQWLMRGDVTSEQFKGHRIKTGVQLLYNDLNDDELEKPGNVCDAF